MEDSDERTKPINTLRDGEYVWNVVSFKYLMAGSIVLLNGTKSEDANEINKRSIGKLFGVLFRLEPKGKKDWPL